MKKKKNIVLEDTRVNEKERKDPDTPHESELLVKHTLHRIRPPLRDDAG